MSLALRNLLKLSLMTVWVDKDKTVKKEWVDVKRIYRELTIKNKMYNISQAAGYGVPDPEKEYMKLYEENETEITLPPLYHTPYLSDAPVREQVVEHEHVKVQFKMRNDFQFRAGQMEPYKALKQYKRGIIQLACGFGKSAIALRHVADLDHPVLIVVHTQDLMEQWRGMISNFLDIEREEIGIAQGQKFECADL